MHISNGRSGESRTSLSFCQCDMAVSANVLRNSGIGGRHSPRRVWGDRNNRPADADRCPASFTQTRQIFRQGESEIPVDAF